MTGIVAGMMMMMASVPEGPGTVAAPPSPPVITAASKPRLKLPTTIVIEMAPPDARENASRSGQGLATVRGSSKTQMVIGTVLGGVAGFYAGGMLGYYATQDRNNPDDDGVSGLRGVVVGAPIGAVVGGLIGFQLAK